MLTRLKLQKGEWKLLVATAEVMPRRRRATRSQSPPPKVPIPTALETPQFFASTEIEEVQAIPISEPESITIMSIEREPEGPSSKEEEFKKAFYTLTEMVKVLYEERNTRMVGESSKPPHGEGSSEDKKDEKKDSKGNGGKPPPSPPSSSSSSLSSPSHTASSSTTAIETSHTHSKTLKGKTPLLKLDIKFKLPMYNGEVNAEKLDSWIR